MNAVNIIFGVLFFVLGMFADHLWTSNLLNKSMSLLNEMAEALTSSQKGWSESNEMIKKIIDGAEVYAQKNKTTNPERA